MCCEVGGQDVVRSPPEEEEGAEEEGGTEAMVDAADAMGAVLSRRGTLRSATMESIGGQALKGPKAYDLGETVNRTAVQPVSLVRGVLDLQARLDVLDGRGDKTDRRARHRPRDAVAHGRQLGFDLPAGLLDLFVRDAGDRLDGWVREDVFLEHPPVEGQGAEHAVYSGQQGGKYLEAWQGDMVHGVHEHPSCQWRRCAFIQAREAFLPEGLKKAIERAIELALG